MFRTSAVYKEVILEQTQTDKWNNICFNRGGTPSTLQDINVVPHSGGYCYKNVPNRFLYWRANHDILEFIEHSLSANLSNNQIRYRFEDAPVLDGITVHEKPEQVIILVPTVTSVHKLVFPHPASNKSYDVCVLSIFAEVSANSARDPIMYRFFDTLSNVPYTANSTLSEDDDALFCFAMNNCSILVVSLQNNTGILTQSYLKLDFGVPRFLSGIKDVFRGSIVKSSNDNVVVSMIFKQFGTDSYIFSLSRNGQLRAWSYKKLQLLCTLDIVPSGSTLLPGAQRNILRGSVCDDNIMLAVYLSLLDGSQIFIIKSIYNNSEGLQMDIEFAASVDLNQDIVEMTLESYSKTLWCIWRCRLTGETSVSMRSLDGGDWTYCINDPNSSLDNYSERMAALHSVTPSELYFNLIFSPGLFSVATIIKVLNLTQGEHHSDAAKSKLDLRAKVCAVVEAEITKEALNYEYNHQDYLEIINRHWSQFYSNCCQYQQSDRQSSGLIWLPESSLLVVIMKTNLSVFRSMEVLEQDLTSVTDTQSSSYGPLIEILKSIKFSAENKQIFIEIENGIQSLDSGLYQIVSEIQGNTTLKIRVTGLLKYNDFSKALRKLSDLLYMPETFENSGEICEMFRGHLGTSIVASSGRKIIETRLEVCYKLALILLMMDSSDIQNEFLSDARNFCKAYSVLNWCCNTAIVNHPDMLSISHHLLIRVDNLRQPMLLDTVWALCEYLWSLTNSKALAEFLWNNNQHQLLQDFARLCDYNCSTWKILLLQSYLESCEPHKAYNLVGEEDNIDILLKVISLFERAEQSNIVIELAEQAISKGLFQDHPDLATLYSILFIHHLKLCHYDDAYNNIERNKDEIRRLDCLREFIIRLMNVNAIDKLLQFPYNGMVSQLDDIMLKRARSVRPHQAVIYYKFLYAFCIKNANYRKAASIMFEQGYRSESNETQRHCFAACLNSLYLVKPFFAWVLKPKADFNITEDEDNLDVLELQDVKREYELASARCKLQNCPTDTTPQEVLIQLMKNSLFVPAMQIAASCKLKLEIVFEALTSACINIHRNSDPWSWLLSNDISELVAGDANATIVAWRLLQTLLEKYEEPLSSVLHKAVANKILSLNNSLPYWLVLSYKKRNTAELLRLFVKYGEMDPAVKLACDLLSAIVTGKGKESFAISRPLNAITPFSSVCIPWNTIDLILLELRSQKMNDPLRTLQICVDEYLCTAEKISSDIMFSQN